MDIHVRQNTHSWNVFIPFVHLNLAALGAPERLKWLFLWYILPDKLNQSQRIANITVAQRGSPETIPQLHLGCYRSSSGNSTLHDDVNIIPGYNNCCSECDGCVSAWKRCLCVYSWKHHLEETYAEISSWWLLCQQCKHYFGRGVNRHSCHYISWRQQQQQMRWKKS